MKIGGTVGSIPGRDSPGMAAILGLAGLYLFALSAWMSATLAGIGLGLMFVAFILQSFVTPSLWRDGLVFVSLAFGAYLVTRTILAIHDLPETRAAQIESASELFRLGFLTVVVTACWLAGNAARVLHVFALALAGFLLGIAANFDTGELSKLLAGKRPDFDMSPNAFGLYCAVAILGMLLLSRRFWGTRKSRAFIVRIITWAVILLILIQGLVFSQSRGAWVAFFVVIPPIMVIQVASRLREKGTRRWRVVSMAILILLVTVLIVALNKELIRDRISSQREGLEAIANGAFTDLPADAYGLRIYWWKLGVEKWMERPFFGWGPGSVEYLFRKSDNKIIRRYASQHKDFHNSLLHVLVQVGIVGTAFLMMALWLILKALRESYAARWLKRDVFLFTMGAIALFLIASMVNLRTRDHFGRFHVTLFGGVAYAYRLRRTAGIKEDSDPSEEAT